ncbi:MAG: leucine-rich repeat domain-containing protein [Clostridia bacterium]|nr:leucine-rich repeat domain-containing protein [Clostridia bacterium]
MTEESGSSAPDGASVADSAVSFVTEKDPPASAEGETSPVHTEAGTAVPETSNAPAETAKTPGETAAPDSTPAETQGVAVAPVVIRDGAIPMPYPSTLHMQFEEDHLRAQYYPQDGQTPEELPLYKGKAVSPHRNDFTFVVTLQDQLKRPVKEKGVVVYYTAESKNGEEKDPQLYYAVTNSEGVFIVTMDSHDYPLTAGITVVDIESETLALDPDPASGKRFYCDLVALDPHSNTGGTIPCALNVIPSESYRYADRLVVYEEGTRRPIPGAKVTLEYSTGSRVSGTTGENGEWTGRIAVDIRTVTVTYTTESGKTVTFARGFEVKDGAIYVSFPKTELRTIRIKWVDEKTLEPCTVKNVTVQFTAQTGEKIYYQGTNRIDLIDGLVSADGTVFLEIYGSVCYSTKNPFTGEVTERESNVSFREHVPASGDLVLMWRENPGRIIRQEPGVTYTPKPVTAVSGRTSDNRILWELSPDGTLKVSGSGTLTLSHTEEICNEVYAASIDVLRLEIGAGITAVGTRAMKDTQIRSVKFSDSLTALESSAFLNCASLASVEWGSSLASVGSQAFSKTALASSYLPASVTEVGTNVFANCSKLKTLVIPEGLAEVPRGFVSGSALETATIPSRVKTVNASAFRNCVSLKSVTLESGGVTAIGARAFEGCFALTAFDFGDALKTAAKNAFDGTPVAGALPVGVEITEA